MKYIRCLFIILLVCCTERTFIRAPYFRAYDINGNNFFLNENKDKHTILAFWATYCIPCMPELVNLQEMHEKYSNKLRIAAVCIDGASLADIAQIKDQFKLSYTLIQDKENKIKSLYGVREIPLLLIINNKKKIILRQKGQMDDLEDCIKRYIFL
ncbi:peroxiredoxin family protein [Spirochaetota bacterium]